MHNLPNLHNPLDLSPTEQRILGTLAEKERTVPDTYPLSLNALLSGCNQKTSRNPLMELGEGEALAALDRLREHCLIYEVSGSRVTRYAHNIGKALAVPAPAVALLAVLMLRGPQTAGELRLNCERLHGFADISSVEGYLQELADRASGALTVELPRTPGTRENRWAHCLGTLPAEEATPAATHTPTPSRTDALAELEARVQVLETELAAIKALLA